ncbi:MAG: MFS transporter [Brevibacterium aurantiacum]|uniref:Putative proline/betaine transporter n=3 Tax=Brevibacterium TaxID=1696 RepID=A0A2H1JKT0_BREAU|nr:MFS transporter [Brevibacterium aurantiacum]MDN5585681.1 MHS family MFS transporter [Brevibacterium sp.]AZT96213.1 MFS transporter [Brevibacterium aurantiacum]MDN5807682.1 MHS family MFS transporter [Brevibacterium sp.]MDN5834137.1 MHS family MFS transporter [Brevibacterium sp.]MDN5909602.1 MHS family MFS transporter [Brevibacterium sp.]
MNNPGSAPISETTPPAPAVDPKQGRRAGSAAFIGTTIEWFDFYIYGTASALVLGDLFFPDVSPAMGTLAAFATFAVGFIARPLGGIVFGHFGDKFGRKNTVITTLLLMGLATVGVGLLPTYEQIGFMAPVLLVILRIIQGVAMGGEWGGAVLIATEFAPPGKKILYGAFAQQGSPVGNLLATVAFLCLTYMSAENFGAWGWRIPFLASAILILVGLYIRLKITESPEMIAATQKEPQKRTPIVELLRNHWKVVSLAIGAVVTGVAITYVKTTFALSWATTDLGFGRTEFLQVVTVALVAQVIVQPFGAVLASKLNASRAILIMLLPELILLPAMFLLIQTGNYWLAMLGMVLATAPHAMYYAALAGVLAQLFPTTIRYTGISVAYQVSTALFAGTAPFLSQALLNATGTIWTVVGLGLFYVVLSAVCMSLLLRGKSWTDREGQPGHAAESAVATAAGPVTSPAPQSNH